MIIRTQFAKKPLQCAERILLRLNISGGFPVMIERLGFFWILSVLSQEDLITVFFSK